MSAIRNIPHPQNGTPESARAAYYKALYFTSSPYRSFSLEVFGPMQDYYTHYHGHSIRELDIDIACSQDF